MDKEVLSEKISDLKQKVLAKLNVMNIFDDVKKGLDILIKNESISYSYLVLLFLIYEGKFIENIVDLEILNIIAEAKGENQALAIYYLLNNRSFLNKSNYRDIIRIIGKAEDFSVPVIYSLLMDLNALNTDYIGEVIHIIAEAKGEEQAILASSLRRCSSHREITMKAIYLASVLDNLSVQLLKERNVADLMITLFASKENYNIGELQTASVTEDTPGKYKLVLIPKQKEGD